MEEECLREGDESQQEPSRQPPRPEQHQSHHEAEPQIDGAPDAGLPSRAGRQILTPYLSVGVHRLDRGGRGCTTRWWRWWWRRRRLPRGPKAKRRAANLLIRVVDLLHLFHCALLFRAACGIAVRVPLLHEAPVPTLYGEGRRAKLGLQRPVALLQGTNGVHGAALHLIYG